MNDLKDALTHVADTSAPGPLSLEHVRGRAKQIRRRRTTASVIGSVVAVAAISGVGVAFLPSDGGKSSIAPATQTPTATEAPTPAPGANEVGPVHGVTLDVKAEQTFAGEPKVPFWHDGQIVDTDGTVTPFEDRPFTFAKDPDTGGWVVIRAGGAHAELVRLDAEGNQVGDVLPTFEHGLAVAPGGELAVLFEDANGWRLTLGGASDQIRRTMEYAAIDGVTRAGDVLLEIDGVLHKARPGDSLDGAGQAMSAVVAPPIGLVASALEDGTWRTDDEDGNTRWTLDWAGVNSFSPDGRYVALVGDRQHRIKGSQDFDSGFATGVIWIRTAADLLPVAAFRSPQNGYFGSWTWDGDELLANVFDRDSGEWSLVRLSADGFTIGRAMGGKGDGEQPAYVFAEQ